MDAGVKSAPCFFEDCGNAGNKRQIQNITSSWIKTPCTVVVCSWYISTYILPIQNRQSAWPTRLVANTMRFVRWFQLRLSWFAIRNIAISWLQDTICVIETVRACSYVQCMVKKSKDYILHGGIVYSLQDRAVHGIVLVSACKTVPI